MPDRDKAAKTVTLGQGDTKVHGIKGQGHEARTAALWLGAGKGNLEMGWGRGPRTLEGHELVSWFFSRDGI